MAWLSPPTPMHWGLHLGKSGPGTRPLLAYYDASAAFDGHNILLQRLLLSCRAYSQCQFGFDHILSEQTHMIIISEVIPESNGSLFNWVFLKAQSWVPCSSFVHFFHSLELLVKSLWVLYNHLSLGLLHPNCT